MPTIHLPACILTPAMSCNNVLQIVPSKCNIPLYVLVSYALYEALTSERYVGV